MAKGWIPDILSKSLRPHSIAGMGVKTGGLWLKYRITLERKAAKDLVYTLGRIMDYKGHNNLVREAKANLTQTGMQDRNQSLGSQIC